MVAVVLVSDWERDCYCVESRWLNVTCFSVCDCIQLFYLWRVTLCQYFISPKRTSFLPSFLPSFLNDLTTSWRSSPKPNCAHIACTALQDWTCSSGQNDSYILYCIFAKDCLHCNVCLSTIKMATYETADMYEYSHVYIMLFMVQIVAKQLYISIVI